MSDEGQGQNFKLMIVVMVVLSLAIAAGTSYFMLNQLGGNGQKSQAKETVNKLGPTYQVGEFTVNLAGGRRFIRLNLTVEISNEDVIKELKKRKPQVRDTVISILRGKKEKDVNSNSGTRALRQEIRKKVNEFVSNGKVSNVFFTEFVVQ